MKHKVQLKRQYFFFISSIKHTLCSEKLLYYGVFHIYMISGVETTATPEPIVECAHCPLENLGDYALSQLLVVSDEYNA